MNIMNMTREDFEALPRIPWNEHKVCDGIIIIPCAVPVGSVILFWALRALSMVLAFVRRPRLGSIRGIHGSGFRQMMFVPTFGGRPLGLIDGGSDVVHIEGIGGFGWAWLERYGRVPGCVPPSAWSIDVLPVSGLLRLFPGSGKLITGEALSSFQIYSLPQKTAQGLN